MADQSPITDENGKQSPAAEDSDPDQAWMVLKLVNEWVRYADAKIAVTFTFIGVTAGALYNLIKSHTPVTIATAVPAAVCTVAIIACGICAGIALFPRVNGKHVGAPGDPCNPLFFGHIARHYDGDRPGYTEVLSTLTRNKNAMTDFVAEQVHGNSLVAAAKLKWVNRAIGCAMVAVAALAALLIIVATV